VGSSIHPWLQKAAESIDSHSVLLREEPHVVEDPHVAEEPS
jgi:hypothetical protein